MKVEASCTTNKVVWGVLGLATSSYNYPNNVTAIGVYGEASSPSVGYAGWFNGGLVYTGVFGSVSDKNLKENIKDLPASIDIVMKIKPKEFSFKKITGLNLPSGNQVGFLAQDMKELLPNLVNQNGLPLPNLTNESDSISTETKEKYLTLNYIGLIPYIIKSIQDQQLTIEKQSALLKSILLEDSITSTTNLTLAKVPHIVKLYPNPAQNQLNHRVLY